MVAVGQTLRLLGSALGAVGGLLVFVEFFQTPSYIGYNRDYDDYELDMAPQEVQEHSWIGRTGGLFLGVGCALLFVGTLV